MSYTVEQEARLTEMGTVTYEQAAVLAAEWKVSHRSVISKVGHMGLNYVKKEVPVTEPKVAVATKAELVASIEKAMGGKTIPGLLGATREALVVVEGYLYS